jgi:hypothetical protein
MIIYARTQPLEYSDHHPLILPFYNNLVFSSAITSLVGFDVSNLATPTTSERWLASGGGVLTVNSSEVGAVSAISNAIAIHGVVGEVSSIAVQGSTGAAYTIPVNSTDKTILILIDDTSVQNIDISFTGAFVGASVVTVGQAVQLPLPKYSGVTPTRYAQQTVMQTDISEGGQYLGATVQHKGYSGSVSFDNIHQTWVRANMGYIVDNSPSLPIFLAIRPDKNKKVTGMGDDVLYCVTTNNINPQNAGNWDYMSFTLEYRGF